MAVSLVISLYQYVIGASMQARHDTPVLNCGKPISSNYCTVRAMRGKHAGPDGDKNAERVGTWQGSPIRRGEQVPMIRPLEHAPPGACAKAKFEPVLSAAAQASVSD